MGSRAMEWVRAAVAWALLAGALALVAGAIAEAGRLKALEADLAEIDDVRYGLLDADNWVGQISAILERRIEAFELTEENRPVIKRSVERVLDRLIVEMDQYQRRRNQEAGGWLGRVGGALRQGVQDLFLDLDDLRAKVPFYAEKILEELSRPEAKAEIRDQLRAALAGLAESTFAQTDRSAFDAVLVRHGCLDAEDCRTLLAAGIEQLRPRVERAAAAAIACVAALFALTLAGSSTLGSGRMLLLTLGALALLAGGVLTPMISVAAEIDSLRLTLLGEPVIFEDQVLYFQSKSVIDVVLVLVRTGAADMLLVGALIALFSVGFPLAKVIASWLYFHDVRGLRGSAPVRFFALKSGKWSMADVFVVAMFMAFIAFRGLVSSQLGGLAQSGKAVEVLTTNGTLLEPGFYLFLAFVLASLVISSVLDARLGERHVT